MGFLISSSLFQVLHMFHIFCSNFALLQAWGPRMSLSLSILNDPESTHIVHKCGVLHESRIVGTFMNKEYNSLINPVRQTNRQHCSLIMDFPSHCDPPGCQWSTERCSGGDHERPPRSANSPVAPTERLRCQLESRWNCWLQSDNSTSVLAHFCYNLGPPSWCSVFHEKERPAPSPKCRKSIIGPIDTPR